MSAPLPSCPFCSALLLKVPSAEIFPVPWKSGWFSSSLCWCWHSPGQTRAHCRAKTLLRPPQARRKIISMEPLKRCSVCENLPKSGRHIPQTHLKHPETINPFIALPAFQSAGIFQSSPGKCISTVLSARCL